jgi:hypothetical protein
MSSRFSAAAVLAVVLAAVTVLTAPVSRAEGSGFANTLRLSPAGAVALQDQIEAVLRAKPGGTQISQSEVSWHGGQVVLALPAPAHSRAALPIVTPGMMEPGGGSSDSCPWSFTARYTCFYADAGFNGRRLQFADTYCSGPVNFGDWGFANTISSWVNNTAHIVRVYDGPNATNTMLWTEDGVSNSAYVGDANNDRADSATIC